MIWYKDYSTVTTLPQVKLKGKKQYPLKVPGSSLYKDVTRGGQPLLTTER